MNKHLNINLVILLIGLVVAFVTGYLFCYIKMEFPCFLSLNHLCLG